MIPLPHPSLTLVVSRTLYRPQPNQDDPVSIVEAAIAGGVDIVQFRARSAGHDQGEIDLVLFAVAMRLREITDGKARFVVTGDLQLAEKCHADGVLLPERSYKPSEARTFLRAGSSASVGAFVRTVIGASRAERGGADYVQVGPIFDTAPETEAASPTPDDAGLVLLRKVKDAVHIPVIAFGGIRTAEQAAQCLRFGADGVAVTDAISDALDPQGAALALRSALESAS